MRQKSTLRNLLASLSMLILGMAGAANAHDHSTPAEGQFYISPGMVAHEGPSAARIGHDGLDTGIGLILGYGLSDRWSLEFLAAEVESDFNNRFGFNSKINSQY